MAGKRITEEQKVQINELFYKYKVKAQVARELGISASSVSKYIIEGYVPIAQRKEITFDKPVVGCDELILAAHGGADSFINNLISLCHLTIEEKAELEELRKEIF